MRWYMQIHRMETTIPSNGTLIIKGLPFQSGDKVEVIVRSQVPKQEIGERYPLRGKPIQYIDPFESVAEDEWNVLK